MIFTFVRYIHTQVVSLNVLKPTTWGYNEYFYTNPDEQTFKYVS